ncbi:MAG: hypothetical protein JRN24_01010, partial [Nitrososphaerota archaeon]|nr:hypothetical protein [Nitrososphaerota archaeon]
MQNIDTIVFLQPVASLAIALCLVIVWWRSKGLRLLPFLLAFTAYFAAIAAKYAIQIPTVAAAESEFGKVSIGLGLYYGLQTVFLEIGLAYLFSLYGARRRGLRTS